MTRLELSDFRVLAEPLDHPECVALGPEGTLYAGGELGQLYRIDEDGSVTLVATTGGFTLGICIDGDNRAYTCDALLRSVMRISPDGTVETYSTGSAELEFIAPNYAVFDDNGRLYVSDSGLFGEDDGRIFVVDPGGETRLLSSEPRHFPNGMAWDQQASSLIVVLSTLPGLARIPIAHGHQAGPLEVFATLDQVVPDGVALDREGGVWIGCYSPDLILRWRSPGGLEEVARDWQRITLASPTNLVVSSQGRPRLFVANFARRHVAVADSPAAGVRPQYPIGLL